MKITMLENAISYLAAHSGDIVTLGELRDITGIAQRSVAKLCRQLKDDKRVEHKGFNRFTLKAAKEKAAPKFGGTLIRSGDNAKTVKGDKLGEYRTAIMYLAPHNLAAQILPDSGIAMPTVCALAVMAKCHAPCLNTAGRGRFNSVQIARAKKTLRYWSNRAAFMAEMVTNLEAFVRFCAKQNVAPACRPNGTSDIQFEIGHACYRNGIKFDSIFAAFPEIEFYDYTKIVKRVYRELPSNYHLTVSYSGANSDYAESVMKAAKDTGCNIAIVYRSKAFRDSLIESYNPEYHFRPVIDGDYTDMRFIDPESVIVGLYAKGKAKTDTSGFVIG